MAESHPFHRRLHSRLWASGRPALVAIVLSAVLAAIGQAPASAAAVNDDFAFAETISGPAGSTSGSNVDATAEPGEPDHAGSAATASIWYQWIAPADSSVTFDTCGSDYDTLLAVYTGTSVDSLTEVGSNDDACATASVVTFNAIAGTVYSIAVDGFGGQTGNVVLAWNSGGTITIPNDDFAAAEVISGPEGTVTASNVGATAESGEPAHAGSAATASIWYQWTAPEDGEVTFDTCGSDFDTVLAVYTGESVDSLGEVGSNDDACGGGGSRVVFMATAGAVYYV
ncbi:MAG TPA: hypothetical protein VF711_13450, partial [Acidimicrobiales bacterium]